MAARPTVHPVHLVLHRPLRLAGIDWRFLLLAGAGGMVALDVASWVTRWDIPIGLMAFLVCYGTAWWTTHTEPAMVPILQIRLGYLLSNWLWRLPEQFDPLHHQRVVVRVK